MDSCTKFVDYLYPQHIQSNLKYLYPNFIHDSKVYKVFVSFMCINSLFPILNMLKAKEAGMERLIHFTIQVFHTEIHQKLFPSFCLFVALELIRSSTRLNLIGIQSPRCIKSCRNVLKCLQHPWMIPSTRLKKYVLRGLVIIPNTNEKLQE